MPEAVATRRPLPLRAVLGACLALATLSLLLPSTPTYDPWTWMVWGREIAGLELDTTEGPAFKPLPVLVGVLFAPFGDAAPWLWLVVAHAGALLAVAMAWRLASRLAGGSLLAGVVAGAGVALVDGWVWNGWLGNAEGLMLALALVASERALDGRHRQALALGLAVALLRTEAVPFVALYAGWAWRRDAAVRPWLVAGAAALPALWLGPDLIGSGDPLRSSERARIPNPGAPALAERPALESLGRAIALAPTLVWAGAALALLGVRRRQLPRAAALPAAAGVAWMALVAAMAEAGYSGEERYALPGVALVSIAAGAGIAWAASRSLKGWVGYSPLKSSIIALVGVVLLGAAVAESAAPLAKDLRDLRYEARLYNSLDDAVDAAGPGPCGPIHTAPYSRPALAWHLEVPLSELSTDPASSGTTFRARPYRGAAVGPPLQARFRQVAEAGEWTVHERCTP